MKATDCKIFVEVNSFDIMTYIHYINKMLSKFRGLINKTSYDVNWPDGYYFDAAQGAVKIDYDDNDNPLFSEEKRETAELSWQFTSNARRVHILFKPSNLDAYKIELAVFVKFLTNRLNIITPEMCTIIKTV